MPPIFGKPAPQRPRPTPQPTDPKGPPPIPTDLWHTVKLNIELIDESTRRTDAKVFGYIAVAPSPDFPGYYDIYCTSINRRIMCCGVDETTALQIGYTLQTTCPMAWRGPTKEDVLEKVPKWVVPWLHACRAAKAWVDPTPHQEASYA